MSEEIEKLNPEEEKQLTCPECGKGFQDMRGITSHARHKHDMSKENIINAIDKNESNSLFNAIAGVGVLIITIITFGRMR